MERDTKIAINSTINVVALWSVHTYVAWCCLLDSNKTLSDRWQIARQLHAQSNNSNYVGHRNDLQRPLKVIGHVTVRYSAYDFLLPLHSNHDPIWYRFPDIARYWSKMAKYIYTTLFHHKYDMVVEKQAKTCNK